MTPSSSSPSPSLPSLLSLSLYECVSPDEVEAQEAETVGVSTEGSAPFRVVEQEEEEEEEEEG